MSNVIQQGGTQMVNAVNWFEIPAADFDRAVQFYSDILGKPLRKEVFMGTPNGFFPYEGGAVGGAVVYSEGYVPSDKGTLVYLNAHGDLDGVVGRVKAAGGKVLLAKTAIGDAGHMAIILDTEGNKVGLNMPKA
jgi:hypothetical protein